MSRNPLAKPTAQRILEGNPGKRPINKKELVPERGIPDPPRVLKGESRKEWERITPRLNNVGLLTHVDRAVLADYCDAWADWVKITQQLAKVHEAERYVYVSPIGAQTISSLYNAKLKASDRLRKLAHEFGLSPVARVGINAPEDKQEFSIAAQLDNPCEN